MTAPRLRFGHMTVRSIGQTGGRRPVLDDLDKAIIKALQLDGRRPYAQIGRQLEVPEATVRQRAERLITRGVVQVVGVTDPLAMASGSPPSSASTSTPAGSSRWPMRWRRSRR